MIELASPRTLRLVLAAAAVVAFLPACHGSSATVHGSFVDGISLNGRVVVFASDSDRIVAGDHNGHRDVFLRNLSTGQTVLVSRPAGGGQANGESRLATVSGNGRIVAFQSTASNLTRGDTDGATDVFVWNGPAGAITRVAAGTRPAVSNSGRVVAFEAGGAVLVWDRSDGQITRLGTGVRPSVTDRLVAFQSPAGDILVWDRVTGATRKAGRGTDPAISPDGRFVAFESGEARRSGITVWDRQSNSSRTLTEADLFHPAVSTGGREVAFDSANPNLVPDDTNGRTDVFVWDPATNAVRRLGRTGVQPNGDSFDPRPSGDGRFVAFDSDASNLVPGDHNGAFDVFLADLRTGAILLMSEPAG